MSARTPLLLLPLLLLAAFSRNACGYEDGAPPGHTGGFGEPDCSRCHSDSEPNPPGGGLEVVGLPDRIAAGVAYDLSLVLQHAELKSGGFQLAFRLADGTPAGKVISLSPRTQTVAAAGPEARQDYLQHAKDGSKTERDGVIRWAFHWIAAGVAGPVHLHVAANAANDDLSPLGDYIFTLERVLQTDTQ